MFGIYKCQIEKKEKESTVCFTLFLTWTAVKVKHEHEYVSLSRLLRTLINQLTVIPILFTCCSRSYSIPMDIHFF